MPKPAERLLDEVRAAVRADPASAGLFCDFDGTLAEVVPDPTTAVPVAGATEALAALAAAGVSVVVVSGRPVDFLARHLPERVDLEGLYGLEWRRGGVAGEHPDAPMWAVTVDQLAEDALDQLGPDVRVENKRLSLTVHWREHPEREADVRTWAGPAAERSGFVVRDAKASVEVHPPAPLDKGAVVAARAAGLATVVCCGDDRGDLSAFVALDGLTAAGALAVRVGVGGPEAPPELLARADLVVDQPAGVVGLLHALLDELGTGRP